MQKQNSFFRELFVVGIGGGIGGTLRYLLSYVPVIGSLPMMTVFINWSGTFLLAMLGAYLASKDSRLASWQTFIGTGVIGGFTTFSTMMLQFHQLTCTNFMSAVVYLLATFLGACLMIHLGRALGMRWGGREQ